jgi:hypothetical protein
MIRTNMIRTTSQDMEENVETPTARLILSEATPPDQVVTYDTMIVRLSLFYLFLIVLLFTWPGYVSAHWHGDGLSLIAELMEIVFFVGGSAFIVSVVTLGVTLRRWRSLSPWVRAVGLFPIVFFILLLIYTQIMVEIERRKHQDDPMCPTYDGEDCPKRKNSTDPVSF